jgi:hypothetical protein
MDAHCLRSFSNNNNNNTTTTTHTAVNNVPPAAISSQQLAGAICSVRSAASQARHLFVSIFRHALFRSAAREKVDSAS